jgi:hypothetical protein
MFAERKPIIGAQATAFETTEATAQISRAAAEHERNIDASRNGEPGAAAGFDAPESEFFVGGNHARMASRERSIPSLHLERATTPGDALLVGKAQPQSAESDFEPCGGFFIADEQVCNPQPVCIQRAP